MRTALHKICCDKHLENIQKLFTLGCYLRKYDLEKVNFEDVTKDTIDLLKHKMETDGNIPTNILATAHYSKERHESYIKYLKENNRNYFDLLYAHKNKYSQLVDHFNYDEITLVGYITRIIDTQGLDLNNAITTLYDYANMNNLMEIPKFDKYPRYLRSMHDIIVLKFNAYKKDNNIPLSKLYNDDFYKYSPTIGKFERYEIKVPYIAADIIEEGRILRHCVSSYVDRVIKGETKILFLRHKDYANDNKDHLLTLQVTDDLLVQAKGLCNRYPNSTEIEFLKQYCENKNLKFNL